MIFVLYTLLRLNWEGDLEKLEHVFKRRQSARPDHFVFRVVCLLTCSFWKCSRMHCVNVEGSPEMLRILGVEYVFFVATIARCDFYSMFKVR